MHQIQQQNQKKKIAKITEVDETELDKPKTVTADLSKLNKIVDNDVAKKCV